MSKSISADSTTFDDEVLAADGSVLVDFWAAWCGPCKQLSPQLDLLLEDHPNLKLVKVNVDDEPDLAMRFKVTSLPTLKLFVGGEVKAEVIGAKPKAALEKDLGGWLGD